MAHFGCRFVITSAVRALVDGIDLRATDTKDSSLGVCGGSTIAGDKFRGPDTSCSAVIGIGVVTVTVGECDRFLSIKD
jgi:hypothetical protein